MKNIALGPGLRRLALVLLACCVLVLAAAPAPAASPSTPSAPSGPLPVAATILPLGDFCRQIGGDLVTVQVLIPPGASPHAFEPAPSVMARAARARVFVYIGAGLEPWAAKLLRASGSKDVVVVEAVRGIPLLGLTPHHHEPGPAGGEDHHHQAPAAGGHLSHGRGNPHIWLDPVLAREICRRIAAAFIQADPAHRARYEANLKDYQARLTALDREIKQQSHKWRLHAYVAFHPAFAYFGRRYGLKEAGIIEASPGREPTPRHLQNLVTAIKRTGIKVVFSEPQLNPRIAEVIAREAGVKVLMLDPIGGRPPYGDDYLKLMRANLSALNRALQ